VGQAFEPSIDTIERSDPYEHGGCHLEHPRSRVHVPTSRPWIRPVPASGAHPERDPELAPSVRGGISFGETAFAQR
jgi:hypothetical protein